MSEQTDKEMEELHKRLTENGQSIHDVVNMIDKSKNAERAAESFATMVVVLPIAFAVSAYAAWLMTYAWGWFVVPLGISQIGVIHAWGLMAIVTFFQSQRPKKRPPDIFKWSCELLAINFLRYSMAFGVCFILHKLM